MDYFEKSSYLSIGNFPFCVKFMSVSEKLLSIILSLSKNVLIELIDIPSIGWVHRRNCDLYEWKSMSCDIACEWESVANYYEDDFFETLCPPFCSSWMHRRYVGRNECSDRTKTAILIAAVSKAHSKFERRCIHVQSGSNAKCTHTNQLCKRMKEEQKGKKNNNQYLHWNLRTVSCGKR